MTDRPPPTMKLEDEIERAVDAIADLILGMSDEPHIQEGLAKAAHKEVCWSLLRRLNLIAPDFADHIDVMADVIRAADDDDEADDEPAAETPPPPAQAALPAPKPARAAAPPLPLWEAPQRAADAQLSTQGDAGPA